MSTDDPSAAVRGSEFSDGLGLDPEREAVLAQLDDSTNQTWAGKRARWAKLVRAQHAEIERLRAELQSKDARIANILDGAGSAKPTCAATYAEA